MAQLPPTMLRRREFLLTTAGAVALAVLAASPLGALAQTGPSGQRLKIATIGAGREGGALGTLFAKAGYPVMFSSRHPEQLGDLVSAAGPNAKAGTVEDAVGFADVVLLVVPYTAVEQIAKDHAKALASKQLVLDVSNPIARRDGEELVNSVEQQGGPALMTSKLLPGAHVVRGFNAIGAGQLPTLAHRQGDPVGVPIAGDDKNALELASRLIRDIGFEPVVIGGLAMGKYLNVGTPLAGVHTPAELKQIASTLK